MQHVLLAILTSVFDYFGKCVWLFWGIMHLRVNHSRPNPGRREKIKLNFYFQISLWCFKRFYEGLKGLHKTFWRTTKKCENKNLTWFLFQYNFQKCTGRSIRQMNGLRFCKIQKKIFSKSQLFSFQWKPTNFFNKAQETQVKHIYDGYIKNLLDLFTSFYAFGDT